MMETIFASSALILAILLLRALLGSRVSARLAYALWLPVALRLLVPWSLPVSSFSAVPADALRNAETALSEPVGRPQPSAVRVYSPASASPAGTGAPAARAPVSVQTPPPATRGDLLHTIWFLGMAVVGSAILCSNLWFYRKLRRTRKRLETAAPCPVYLAGFLPSPCLFGRAVYLPEPLEGDTLRHVLAHELTHRRHGDTFWAILTAACVTAYWFHPLVWLAAALSRRDCELACDEGALARLSPQERIAYGRTLLAMAGPRHPAGLFCPAAMMGESAMRTRVRRIAEQPRTRTAAILALAAGLILACAGTCTSPDRFVSREVLSAVRAGCRSDSPAERAAWEMLRDEFLPAYREAAAAAEGGPVLLESVRLRRDRLGLAMGSEYDTLFWDLRPDAALSEETLAALGLHESRDNREWPLWFHAGIAEQTDADGNRAVTDDHDYYQALRSEHDALRWEDLELYIPGDDFQAIADAFLTAIGELHLSAPSGNSGAAIDYTILTAEVYDTLPDSRDYFAFLGRVRFTPVDFPNSHWAAGGGVFENSDGTIDWETEIAVARGPNNVWRITDHGWAVRADRTAESGWYSNTGEAVPQPLAIASDEPGTVAQEYLEQYGAQLRALYERKNLCGAQSVTFSHLYTYRAEEVGLDRLDIVPKAHPEAFYVTAEAAVALPAAPMEWAWYGLWERGDISEDGRRHIFFGLALWKDGKQWDGCFLDPAAVAIHSALSGELASPDGSWGLSVGAATEADSPWMVTLYSMRTGKVRWEDTAYLQQTALWSPDSRYVALTRAARRFTEVIIVDTEDFSALTVPQPGPPEGWSPPAADPATNPVNTYALEWLDGQTLRCRAEFPTDHDQLTAGKLFFVSLPQLQTGP